MCKANLKLQAFSYVLFKLVGLQRDMNPACREKSDQEIIQMFSNTRLMKLLYLLCLEGYEEARRNDREGSFFLFDRMLAYPNGIVEQDVYDALPLIPHTEYDGNHFIDIDSDILKKLENLPEYRWINNAVGRLGNLKSEIFNNQCLLIDLVHRLPNWRQVYSPLSLNAISIDDNTLSTELRKYREEEIFRQVND